MLILDDRETDLAPYLKAFDVPVSITRLDSGDARWEACGPSGPILVGGRAQEALGPGRLDQVEKTGRLPAGRTRSVDRPAVPAGRGPLPARQDRSARGMETRRLGTGPALGHLSRGRRVPGCRRGVFRS